MVSCRPSFMTAQNHGWLLQILRGARGGSRHVSPKNRTCTGPQMIPACNDPRTANDPQVVPQMICINFSFRKHTAKILNPLSKFLSPHIFKFYVGATISGPGSFTVQSGHHFRSWDHLRCNLGIICGIGIICGPVQSSFSLFKLLCFPPSFMAAQNHERLLQILMGVEKRVDMQTCICSCLPSWQIKTIDGYHRF